MNQTSQNRSASIWQSLDGERVETADVETYGLGEDKFRRFQEERKLAAVLADKEEQSRELASSRSASGRPLLGRG